MKREYLLSLDDTLLDLKDCMEKPDIEGVPIDIEK